jgi:hypothetical protein
MPEGCVCLSLELLNPTVQSETAAALNYLLHIIQSTQHKMSIFLQRHVSTHLSLHQATIRTIYAYKLTVRILESQTDYNFVT